LASTASAIVAADGMAEMARERLLQLSRGAEVMEQLA
jgi:hypothetical protein